MIRHALAAALILALPAPSPAQGPESVDTARRHYLAGVQHEARRELDAAQRAYEEAVRHDPSLAVARDRLGFVYGLQGRTTAAIAEFERATKSDPRLFDAFYHLGATLWWTGDAARALAPLRTIWAFR
jgi:tetratricopeptide (TPR) repeat protein